MKKHQPISILLVGSVSALVHGILALVFAPILAMLFSTQVAAPVQFAALLGDGRGMLLAVLLPFAWAAVGFIAAATVAFLYNLSAIDASIDEVVLTEPAYFLRAASRAA